MLHGGGRGICLCPSSARVTNPLVNNPLGEFHQAGHDHNQLAGTNFVSVFLIDSLYFQIEFRKKLGMRERIFRHLYAKIFSKDT